MRDEISETSKKLLLTPYMSPVIRNFANKLTEKRICSIKDNILRHKQNPEDYQHQLENLFERTQKGMYEDIQYCMIRLILFVIMITIIISFIEQVLTNSYNLILILFCTYLFLSLMRNIRKILISTFGNNEYDLDEYHTWQTTKKKK